MRTIKTIFIFIFLFLTNFVYANTFEYTSLIEVDSQESNKIQINLDGDYSLSLPDDFGFWTDIKKNKYFESKLIVFQKIYPNEEEKGHTLHVQFLNLTKAGVKEFKKAEDYIALIKTTTKSRRDKFESKKLQSQLIDGREFSGLQYISTISGSIEEGIIYASLKDTNILIVRVQEIDQYRLSLAKMVAYALTLRNSIENTDNEPLL